MSVEEILQLIKKKKEFYQQMTNLCRDARDWRGADKYQGSVEVLQHLKIEIEKSLEKQ